MEAIARGLELPPAQLRWMNPVLCGTQVPAYHSLLLPMGGRQRFEVLMDTLMRMEERERLHVEQLTAGTEEVQRLADGREATYHRVRPGDQLGRIASRYGVRLSELRAWNQLKGDHIEVGELLTIYVTAAARERNEGTTGDDSADTAPTAPTKEPAFTWYTVRRGDSLYSIAKRHRGISADDLMRLNNLGPNIKAGQRIKIPR
jgi:membrane-bound lytic murein transglycosylase D